MLYYIRSFSAIWLIISGLLQVGNMNGAEPKYGAYPENLKPKHIDNLIGKILGKYHNNNIKLSVLSKELLVNGLNEAGRQVNRKYFGLAEKIESFETNNIKDVLTEKQQVQFNLFRQLQEYAGNEKPVQNEVNNHLRNLQGASGKEALTMAAKIKEGKIPDYILTGFYLHNAVWGINRPVGMMWLDSYRVPAMQVYQGLIACVGKGGKLKGVENEALADAAFLFASLQMYKLCRDMSLPMSFVTSAKYSDDLLYQEKLLAASRMPGLDSSRLLMRKSAEAQIKNTFKGSAGDALDADRSWYRGSFMAGIMAAWRATGDDWYLSQAKQLAERTRYQPGPNAIHDANDLAIAQTYLELYEAKVENSSIQPVKIYLDSLIKLYNPQKTEWSWCDALFMSPPSWARMGKITADIRYFDHMDKLWWQTSALIYDKKHKLFFRDRTYLPHEDGFQIRERNGKPVFWGRGNGWVIGGLCRVLEYLPEFFPSRPAYEAMFRDMCRSLIKLQGHDGLWRASLLDPESYPMGETSSSTFYCYGLAWGINHGLLDKKTYLPSALKAWKALSACINPENGRLEYVQLPADSPRSPVYKHCNVEYATGAYLLAGSEILKLLR